MVRKLGLFLMVVLLGAFASTASAQNQQFTLGGDRFGAGDQTGIDTPVQGDAFIAGSDVVLSAPVDGSAHMAGFNVNSNAAIGSNFYGAGFTVNITAPVDGNVTAAGRTVALSRAATVGGNVRIAGASVSLAPPVEGAVLVSAETLTLSGTIAGDFSFFGRTIEFAPGARIDGAVDIHAPEAIAVPASVAPADRVSYASLEDSSYVDHAGRTAETIMRGFWPMVAGFAAVLIVLVLIGAILMAFFPRRLENMQLASEAKPLRSFGWGILTFAMLLGLVPLVAMTIVGILVVPFVVLAIVVCLGLAFVLGAYLVGTRVARTFAVIDTNLKRLAVMAASLVAVVVLGLIPFIGWLLSLLVVTFGLGAAVRTMIAPRPDMPVTTAGAGSSSGTPANA